MKTHEREAPKRFQSNRERAEAAEVLAALDALTFEEMTEEAPAEAPQPEPVPVPAEDLEDDDLRDLNLDLSREEVYAEALEAVRTLDAHVKAKQEADCPANQPRHGGTRTVLGRIHYNEARRMAYALEAEAQGKTVRAYRRSAKSADDGRAYMEHLELLTPAEKAARRREQSRLSKQRKRAEARAMA